MATGTPKKRRGRPALPPGEGKKIPLNMRTTQEIRDKLESAAKQSGRSLTHEVEYRVEQSFRQEARVEQIQEATRKALVSNFGSEVRYKLMLIIAGLVGLVEEKHNNRSWLSDRTTFHEAKAAVDAFLESMGPKRPPAKGHLHEVDLIEIQGEKIGQAYSAHFRETVEAKIKKGKR